MVDSSAVATHAARDLSRYRAAAALLAVLVLVQAVLAGQFVNTSSGVLAPHRMIGEGSSLVALALLVAGYRIRSWSRDRWWLAGVLVALVVAQTGLGFAGRSSPLAASLHVPVGVLLFGGALVAAVDGLRR